MKIGARIRQLRKAKKMTILELATLIGSDVGNISRLETGKQGYTEATITKLAEALGVKVVELFSEEQTIPEMASSMSEPDFYRVDVLDVQASAGSGSLVSTDFIEKIRAIEYTTEQARALFGNRPHDTVKVITVRGDSMEGTINPGDEIFVDTAVTHFDGDGVYVFVFGKTLHVKRLQMQRNRLSVLSDNSVYKEWFVEDGDEDQFHIMAKVLLRQSIDYKRFG